MTVVLISENVGLTSDSVVDKTLPGSRDIRLVDFACPRLYIETLSQPFNIQTLDLVLGKIFVDPHYGPTVHWTTELPARGTNSGIDCPSFMERRDLCYDAT